MIWIGSMGACSPSGSPPSNAPSSSSPPDESAAPPPPTPQAGPTYPSEGSAAPTPDDECETRRAAIESALSEANHCETDAECTLMYPNCPFGCARPVSTSANLEAVRANVEAYNSACNACVYRCMPPQSTPTCRSGRCAFDDG